MMKFDEWFFPDGESHLPRWMSEMNKRIDGRLTYQHHKYEYAMQFVDNKKLAIDVGAHVGLWSFYMARDFEHVACFEPVEAHQECWYRNMEHAINAELFDCALGERCGFVTLKTNATSSGDTWIDPDGTGDIEQKPLDYFSFENVGLIKIDCEGYEIKVIEGALNTILKSKPVIVVEQKGNMIEKYGYKQLAAVELLKSHGAKVKDVISGDYILAWDK